MENEQEVKPAHWLDTLTDSVFSGPEPEVMPVHWLEFAPAVKQVFAQNADLKKQIEDLKKRVEVLELP